jgi:hypothetical protein
MKLDERCERHPAAGKAGAADVPEPQPVAETACLWAALDASGQSLGRATFCRAGFAGRGMAVGRSTEHHTLASALDPRRSLGALS